MNRSLTVVALGILLAATAAACSDDRADPGQPVQTDPSTTAAAAPGAEQPPATPSSASGPAANPLEGRRFVGDDGSVTGHTLVEGTELFLHFDSQQVSSSAGCNTLQGAYVIDSTGTLILDDLSSTAMGCLTPGVHEQDEWLSAFLQNRPTIAANGPTLTLTDGAATITLTDREIADPDRSFEGTTWTLNGQINGQTASHSLVAAPATLTFADGVLSVHTGCNTGSAAYELSDGTVTVQPVALTRMACDEPTMQQEAAIVTVLDGTMTYAIDAGMLTLRNGSNGLTLTTE